MAAEVRYRYFYRRERADGSANETTALKNFEKWLKEAQSDDRFFVARLQWVECERDGTIVMGGYELPHVKWVCDAGHVEN